MKIDKNTMLYGSFSKNAGSVGCKLFNTAFAFYDLNCLYKSFSINDIAEAVNAAKCLGMGGFAVSMPYKRTVLELVDEISEDVKVIGAANTIVKSANGILKAYNTDFLAAKEMVSNYESCESLVILGNGGYAAAVIYAAELLKKKYEVISRKTWLSISHIKNSIVYNCTPVENIQVHESNVFIDGNTNTEMGKKLALMQAAHQFKLYTGLEFPFR